MLDYEPLKAVFEQQLAELQQALAELLVEAQLDHADVRGQWNRVDDALQNIRAEVARIDERPELDGSEVAAAVRMRLDEVKTHLANLRRRHWPSP